MLWRDVLYDSVYGGSAYSTAFLYRVEAPKVAEVGGGVRTLSSLGVTIRQTWLYNSRQRLWVALAPLDLPIKQYVWMCSQGKVQV